MVFGDYDVVVGLCGSLQVVLGCCGWFRLVVDGFWLVFGCSGWFRLVVMVLAGVVVGVFGWFWVFLAGYGWLWVVWLVPYFRMYTVLEVT